MNCILVCDRTWDLCFGIIQCLILLIVSLVFDVFGSTFEVAVISKQVLFDLLALHSEIILYSSFCIPLFIFVMLSFILYAQIRVSGQNIVNKMQNHHFLFYSGVQKRQITLFVTHKQKPERCKNLL